MGEDGDAHEVTFLSFSGLVKAWIVRHVDRYRAGSYVAKQTSKSIGTGLPGFVY